MLIDVDGHTFEDTAWGKSYTGVAYTLDSDFDTFNSDEANSIRLIWARVAEDFAPFDVDVTTEEPDVFDTRTLRCLITQDFQEKGGPMPASGAGGVAYVNVFGRDDLQYYQPALVYYNNLGGGRDDFCAEVSSHEVGLIVRHKLLTLFLLFRCFFLEGFPSFSFSLSSFTSYIHAFLFRSSKLIAFESSSLTNMVALPLYLIVCRSGTIWA